jgi:hypothetical protein
MGMGAVGAWLTLGQKPADGISIRYVNSSGQDAAEGISDSPLTALVRFPANVPESQAVAVSLQLVDATGKPAKFGPNANQMLPMRPTVDIGVWEYTGSVPSEPGEYHARMQVQIASADSRVTTHELAQPVLRVSADSNPPLTGGYVFKRGKDLWLLSEDASRERRLTFFSETGQTASDPNWSPDGQEIAFAYLPKIAGGELPRSEIWSIKPDGTDLRKLVAPGPDETLIEPAWSRDSKAIFFAVDRLSNTPIPPDAPKSVTDQYRRIDRVDPGTNERTQVVLSAQTPAIGRNGDMAYLEDVPPLKPGDTPGQRLVYMPDGSKRSVLVEALTYLEMQAPAISPDSKWVVFSAPNGNAAKPESNNLLRWLLFEPNTAYAHELPWDLFMVSTAGGTPIRLTTMDEDEPFPVWLDSSTIAFLGETGLYRLTIAGNGSPRGAPTRLREGLEHSELSWHAP